MTTLEVLFAPAEFEALAQRPLQQTVCVVFDILRATSSMVTALGQGAHAIIPVASIPEALAAKARQPDVLLAGERDGLRITAQLTGSIDFDLGNSPREFTSQAVAGRTIVSTTTNGTRALRACLGARQVLAGSFLNLQATADYLRQLAPSNLLLVCSGTHEQAALEDILAAGALCQALWPAFSSGAISDSAHIARQLFQAAQSDLAGALGRSRNGQRLLQLPELRQDVAFCAQLDRFNLVAALDAEAKVVRLAPAP